MRKKFEELLCDGSSSCSIVGTRKKTHRFDRRAAHVSLFWLGVVVVALRHPPPQVLISSDKRGIDSHGVGRLKPIYCDRMDVGILKPVSRLTIVKQTATTAVVDGGIGLGLAIGRVTHVLVS